MYVFSVCYLLKQVPVREDVLVERVLDKSHIEGNVVRQLSE
jgi:hypothetical protein